MPDPLQYEFWSAEERRMWEEFGPTALTLIMKGAKAGENALPPSLRVLINWNVFNDKVVAFLNRFRLEHLGGINEVSRRHAVSAIETWIKGGEPLPMLVKRLEPWFGPTRAERVAVTEVTRLYAEGNQQAWSASGLVGANKWQTGRDDRVCPVCSPLHNVVVPLGEGFTPSGPGMGPTGPPLHTRCRCYLLPVVSEQLLREQVRDILGEYEVERVMREVYEWQSRLSLKD